eukprot:4527087-Pyramimonas_sp.AAC.1
MSYHSFQAGAAGIGDLALGPGQSARASEHLGRALGLGAAQKEFYHVQMPCWDKTTEAMQLFVSRFICRAIFSRTRGVGTQQFGAQ